MRTPANRGRARAVVVAALGAVALLSCLEPTAGQVDLPGLDVPVEKAIAFPAGKKLEFPVHADRYEHGGGNHVRIEVTLLRGGAPVGVMACNGFELEGGAGCGTSATHLSSACAMTVPAGGSDAIRAVARLANRNNAASFEGLSVYIRD
ncbi:hypothetical protein WMF18_31950 [Sorangium sp. So ce315]|uniref:hypothetical protein n=1 Tax=Sorangium sp. So ce315 TaxID=3133299 RepID=UPI003F6269E0